MTLLVLDLFAGCGGMALGFKRAGFRIIGGIECDPKASATFRENFFTSGLSSSKASSSIQLDITEVTPHQYHKMALAGPKRKAVDVIIGGPPCQAFARIGRAKLREVAGDPDAYLNDHRAGLYISLLTYVDYFRPLAVVFENVPDILNHGDSNVAEEVACSLEELGYKVRYTLLNSAHYGVPQFRTRLILIALHSRLREIPRFPSPTHYADLPRGHQHFLRLGVGQYRLFEPPPLHFVDPPRPAANLPRAVTAQDGLADLPAIRRASGSQPDPEHPPRYRRGVRASGYAAMMRKWPGFSAGATVEAHVARDLPRDDYIFRHMSPGDNYPAAKRIAMSRLGDRLRRASKKRGSVVRKGSAEYRRILGNTVPPYDESKYPDKWRKLYADRPSHTLTAHLGKDSYSHIHYDSSQARVISVREAARLQSFPDGFRLPDSMNAALRQIGNAVPPLLAHAVARELKKSLTRAKRRSSRRRGSR